MPEKKKFLSEDRQHTRETSHRWGSKYSRNQDGSSPDYKDEWASQECLSCQYYIKLMGNLGMDWGVCSNPLSPLDSRLMFEHDGCEFYSFASDEDWGEIPKDLSK